MFDENMQKIYEKIHQKMKMFEFNLSTSKKSVHILSGSAGGGGDLQGDDAAKKSANDLKS